jgi:ribonuclease D
MELDKLPEPELITRPDELERLVARLEDEPIVAVDTESNSLYAYYEQVCLVQFSTPDKDYLVDPLVLEDLSSLALIFESPTIEKVFHAAEYDLICLRRDFSFRFNNLFDTMVGASILGLEQVGLGSLLESEFDVHLDKRYQRANWGQRPLPAHLLTYARLDTRFLIPLRNRLKDDLKNSGRWPLAEEDFRRMSLIGSQPIDNHNKANNRSVEEACWRISGSHDLSPQQAAVLQSLCRYRDEVARSINRPLFKVISDSTLYTIAESLPSNLNDLRKLPGMTHGQMQRHGASLIQVVRRGLQAPPLQPPRNRKPDENYVYRLENLRQWRKTTAKDMGVKSDVILPRDLLTAIAEKNPRTYDDLQSIMEELPCRLKKFGDEILQVLYNHS